MIGQLLNNRWMISDRLSGGGQSTTYKARDFTNAIKSDIVIKVFNEKQYRSRIEQEIALLKDLEHPNVLKLIDTGVASSGEMWLAVSYCTAGSLENKNFTYPRDRNLIFELFSQILDGIAYLHSHDPIVVHRDIKPANILLKSERGPAVVSDFGICYLEGTDRYTLSNEQVGPRFYMAPELEDGRLNQVSPVSDVYSLGKLLYWMLHGRIFSREQHRSDNWDLTKIYSDPSLEHINRLFDKMIVLSPSNRFKNASEVKTEFEKCVELIRRGNNAVSLKHPQRCIYCGIGEYKVAVLDNTTSTRNFGITPVGASRWLVLVCPECGNSQMFRLDKASKRNEWWDVPLEKH